MDEKITRIIDANFNRLREALRIVEEVARFVLDNKTLSQKLKYLRAKTTSAVLSLHQGDDLVYNRDSINDVGRDSYPKTEATRENIYSIITSNLKRAQEAARALEEFSKLINKSTGYVFKNIRFSLYDIEKEFVVFNYTQLKQQKLNFDLYVVTDPMVIGKRSLKSCVIQAIKGGAKIIQLRDKTAPMGTYYNMAKELSVICERYNVAFIVNDYLDICLAVDADGVHLGQDDIPIPVARKILGDKKIIGLSTHSYSQAMAGLKSGADYISIGPIFPTPSKPHTQSLGIETLRKIANSIKSSPNKLPFVAIGGINNQNITEVIKYTKRIAVIRSVFSQENITKAVKNLRDIIVKN